MAVGRVVLSVAAVAALGLSVLPANASANEAPEPSASTVGIQAQPDPVARGIIVQTTTATPSDAALDATDDALGPEASVAGDDKVTGKISTIDFDQAVDSRVATDVAEEIAKRPDVVWAVPNRRVQRAAASPVIPNDPLFVSQRNLWDTKIASPAGGYSTKAPKIWPITRGSSDVRVAVLDTGILKSHPDLDGKLVDGWDFVGADDPDAALPKYRSANDGDGWDSDPSDPGDWTTRNLCYSGQLAYPSSWHGTSMAGLVAAKADNAIGVAGVAPDVMVQPVRVLGRCGAWDSDILAAITWASGGHVDGVPDNPTPAQVINMSLGQTYEVRADRNSACLAYNPIVNQARERGSLVVASAGNAFWDASLAVPASCTGVTSVMATSSKGFKAVYSNSGNTVDLAAPGGDTKVEGTYDSIVSLGNKGTKTPGAHSYIRGEGSSASASQVSGAAALIYGLLAEHGPVSVAELESALYSTVSGFHPSSTVYRSKKVTYDGRTYTFSLNCTVSRCGRGILDLNKIPVPLTPPKIIGDPVIGEPLRIEQGEWNGAVPAAREVIWRADGVIRGEPGGSGEFRPTSWDIGKTITAEVRPATLGYNRLSLTSAATAAVPSGPTVTIGYIGDLSTLVNFTVMNGSVPAADGDVEVRRDDTDEVVATGQVVNGVGAITVPENMWRGGYNRLRVAYLGSGPDGPSSSAAGTYRHSLVSSQVKLTLAKSVSHRSRATLKIAITGQNATNRAGPVRIYDKGKLIVRVTMPTSGLATVRLPKLSKGTHQLKVNYWGNSLQLKSSSAYKSIRSY